MFHSNTCSGMRPSAILPKAQGGGGGSVRCLQSVMLERILDMVIYSSDWTAMSPAFAPVLRFPTHDSITIATKVCKIGY